MGAGGDTPAGDPASTGGLAAGQEDTRFERSMVLTAARGAIFEEDNLLRQSMERVGDWALTWPTGKPRMLLVVGAGFDEDPVDFYLPFIERMETQSAAGAREEFKRFRQEERVDRVGQDLAAAGWLVVPVATQTTGSQTGAAEIGGGDRFQMFMSAQPDAIRTSYAQFLLLDPLGAHSLRMSESYVNGAVEKTGSINLVTGVLFDFRAYDTLGEAVILYTAALGVLTLLRIKGKN